MSDSIKVRLTKDLTFYHPKLLPGLEGVTAGHMGRSELRPLVLPWDKSKFDDRCIGVHFPEVGMLHILWRDLEITDDDYLDEDTEREKRKWEYADYLTEEAQQEKRERKADSTSARREKSDAGSTSLIPYREEFLQGILSFFFFLAFAIGTIVAWTIAWRLAGDTAGVGWWLIFLCVGTAIEPFAVGVAFAPVWLIAMLMTSVFARKQ